MEGKSDSNNMEQLLDEVLKQCGDEIKNNKYTIEEKNIVKARITKLSENEMGYIFRLVIDHKESYQKNKNGIFLDLNKISEECFGEIQTYINTIHNIKQTRAVVE